ncbi:MAG: methyltransferase domain-containing protein [Chthoniobacterales bacterium]
MPSAAAGGSGNAPHSVDWEGRYQSNDTPWDKGFAAPPLIEWMEQNEFGGRVLVPGCGTGYDVREIARSGAYVIGLDLAPSAINFADAQPRIGSERYRLANFLELPPEMVGAFDFVFEHTLFCAIDPACRPTYVRSAAASLAPGGKLVAIFFLDVGHGEDGPPFGTSRDELDALFDEQFEVLEESVPTRSYEGREGCELLRIYRRR